MKKVLLDEFPTHLNTFEKIKSKYGFINPDYINDLNILGNKEGEFKNPCDLYNFLDDNGHEAFSTIAKTHKSKDGMDFWFLLSFFNDVQTWLKTKQENQFDDLNHNNKNNDNKAMETSEGYITIIYSYL
jgi:hypothetical protein